MDDLISTVLIGVLSIFLIVILYNFFFYFFFEKILFQGVSLPLDHKFEFEKEFEEVNILVNSSTSLHALLFKSPSPKGLILYFHGNRGNLTRWGEIYNNMNEKRDARAPRAFFLFFVLRRIVFV